MSCVLKWFFLLCNNYISFSCFSFNYIERWFFKVKKRNFLSEHLNRLHMILKPFMLRRVKTEVENELSDKIEVRYWACFYSSFVLLYSSILPSFFPSPSFLSSFFFPSNSVLLFVFQTMLECFKWIRRWS